MAGEKFCLTDGIWGRIKMSRVNLRKAMFLCGVLAVALVFSAGLARADSVEVLSGEKMSSIKGGETRCANDCVQICDSADSNCPYCSYNCSGYSETRYNIFDTIETCVEGPPYNVLCIFEKNVVCFVDWQCKVHSTIANAICGVTPPSGNLACHGLDLVLCSVCGRDATTKFTSYVNDYTCQ